MFDVKNLSSPVDVIEGETYSVPFTKMKPGCGQDAPIMPYPHEDKAEFCLGDTPQHVHFDRRFMEEGEYLGRDGTVLVAGLNTIESVEMREMVCRKAFHADSQNPFSVAKLYERYQGSKLKNRRCVHNGVLITNKCGTCPAHGLKWDLSREVLQEFKLPFRLAFNIPGMPLGALGSGELVGAECRIVMLGDYKYCGVPYKLTLIDSDGKVYPGSEITLNYTGNWSIGDTFVFTGKDCR